MTDNSRAAERSDELQPATEGAGPLLQRDYWVMIDRCEMTPAEVLALVAERFCEFPPIETVKFTRSGGDAMPLDVGDIFDIEIRMAGRCRVKVVHMDDCSFTLATLKGHPEAGRITFGAYRHENGGVIFHIRSRARSQSLPHYLGFLSGGDPMQTTTWTDFVNSVALTCGEGVVGFVHAETRRIDHGEMDEGDARMDRPTYAARGQ